MKKRFWLLFICLLILYNSLNFLSISSILTDSTQKFLIEIPSSNPSDPGKASLIEEQLTESITKTENQFLPNEIKASTEVKKFYDPEIDALKTEDFFNKNNTLGQRKEKLKNVECKFPEYHFSQQEIALIWKYKPYRLCSTMSKDTILIENDQLRIQCESKKKPEFFEEISSPETFGGSKKIIGNWTHTIPDLTQKNFTFIKCQEKSIYSMVFIRSSKSISLKSKRLSDSIKSQKNLKNSQKMSILLLTLDSVSKGSAERNLKKTLTFLNTQSSFNFYDLKTPGISGGHSQDNMAPILYGESKSKIQEILGTRIPSFHSKIHEEYQKKAIWSHFSSLGYVTMFLHDTVWDFLSYLTGARIFCDHVFTNYWKVVWTVYGFHDFQDGQRCIGNQNSHNISFGYIYRFFEVYPENNKFSYVHLNAAHEKKGNIQTVDEDLKDFLGKFVKLFNSRNESFVIFLIGDHGQRRVEMQFDIRNSYEVKQPMSYIITDKKFEGHEILDHNKNILFSRFDLHLSLKDLSFFPYLKLNDLEYEELKKNYEVPEVKSLFREKISSFRNCEDLGVPYVFCPCSQFLRTDSEEDLKLLRFAFVPMVGKVLLKMNKGKNCQIPEMPDVIDYQKFILSEVEDGFEVLYSIHVKIDEKKITQFKVRGCTEKKIMETKNFKQGKMFESTFYVYDKLKMFYQVYEVNGSGTCGEIVSFH